jgi:hypothetical protein
MSGGSMAYCFEKVEEAARQTSNPMMRDLLEDVALVLHDEEWWISSDITKDEYKKTLADFGRKWLRKKWRPKEEKEIEGKWKPNFAFGMYPTEKFWICSKCNRQSMEMSPFCKHCGTMMKNGEEEK